MLCIDDVWSILDEMDYCPIQYYRIKVAVGLALLSLNWEFPRVLLSLLLGVSLVIEVQFRYRTKTTVTTPRSGNINWNTFPKQAGIIIIFALLVHFVLHDKIPDYFPQTQPIFHTAPPAPYWVKYVLGLPLLAMGNIGQSVGVAFYVFCYSIREFRSTVAVFHREKFLSYEVVTFDDNVYLFMIITAQIILSIGVCSWYALIMFSNSRCRTGINLRHFTRNYDISGVETLLKMGADPNSTDVHGMTPLHICAQQAMLKLSKRLIKQGADPNMQDRMGFTPLHWAVQMRKEETDDTTRLQLVRYLVEKGGDLHLFDVNGITALDIATKKGNARALHVLEELTAESDDDDDHFMAQAEGTNSLLAS